LPDLIEFINRMPKVELHLHLEGSIRPVTALELFYRQNPGAPHIDYSELSKLYRFDSLGEFVNGMQRITNNIQSLEDLQRITAELLESLCKQNVHYVEFDCAVQKYLDIGFPLDVIIDSIYTVVKNFQMQNRIVANLNINLLRGHGPEKAERLVQQIIALNHPFIRGIGLSGDEAAVQQKEFTLAFQIAREAGLHRTAHAGESMGAQSIWDAIHYLQVERIDHGTRASEDDQLMDYLALYKIPLTQCLTSNVRLKVVDSYEQHPFQQFLQRGICVTLNTDDPHVFDITLTGEYQVAAMTFNLTALELRQIVLNSIRASFMSDEEKNHMQRMIAVEIDALLSHIGREKTALA